MSIENQSCTLGNATSLKRVEVALFVAAIFLVCAPKSGAQRLGATGTISGRVTADHGDVRAFRIEAHDIIHKISYTVFTIKGGYHIYNLPRSTYEMKVVEDAFNSPLQTVHLDSEETKTADLALTEKLARADEVTRLDYDELYPPGPGRDILEEQCWGCHGPAAGWHKRGGGTEESWAARFMRMYDQDAYLRIGKIAGIGAPPALDHGLADEQKQTIVKYLAANFPPNQSPRDWKLDPLVRNEEALAHAIYIQYEFAPLEAPPFADGSRPGIAIHDVFPSDDSPGLVWAANTGGTLLAVNTHDLDFETRTKSWPIPDPNNMNVGTHGLFVRHGHVYYAGLRCDCAGELDLATGQFQRYPARTPLGGGHTVYVDSKKNIWFSTVYGKSRINRVDGLTKEITEYDPVPGANWYGVITDKQDRLWAVGYGSFHGVIMYDPETKKWTKYATTGTNRRITIDQNGKVWAVQYFGNALSKIDPNSGQVKEYKLPLKYGNPYEGWSDQHGDIWIDNEVYDSLVKFDQKTEKFTYFPYPVAHMHTPKMQVDSEGTLWFSRFTPRPTNLVAFKPNGNVPSAKASAEAR